MAQDLLGDFYALINSKEWFFCLTVGDTNNDLIKEVGCTTYEILVPTGKGVECSWIDSCNHNVGVGKVKNKISHKTTHGWLPECAVLGSTKIGRASCRE